MSETERERERDVMTPTLNLNCDEVMLRSEMLTTFNRGKPAGTNVSWIYTHETRLQNYTGDDDGQAYKIKSATVKMDWSDWYKS